MRFKQTERYFLFEVSSFLDLRYDHFSKNLITAFCQMDLIDKDRTRRVIPLLLYEFLNWTKDDNITVTIFELADVIA